MMRATNVPAATIVAVIVLGLAHSAHATTVLPSVAFTLRDDGPIDGTADRSSPPTTGFFSFITNSPDFVDETFAEFAVGPEPVSSAILSLTIFNGQAADKSLDISSFDNGNGSPDLSLFGTGTLFSTVVIATDFGHQLLMLDVSALYSAAMAHGDAFLGFRLHNVVPSPGGNHQVTYTESQLDLTPVPEPATWGLFFVGLAAASLRRRTK